jgi:hypothetical protein
MSLSLRCPHCKQLLLLPDEPVGKQFHCPLCNGAFAAPSPPPAPVSKPGMTCPACASPLLEGAVACMDCGYLLGSEAGPEAERPVICINPACGVANPPGERYCQRCAALLPTPSGTILHDRYRIRKLLALGGFGAVYLAEDTNNGDREVAIKEMICPDPQEFAIRLSFFRREAENLKLLAGVPCVPRFHDLIEGEQTALLIMEYLRGRDLFLVLDDKDGQPFPFDLVIEWGKQLCDLLTAMHSQGQPLLHGGVSPSSLLLLEDQRSIRVVDFSLAQPLARRIPPQERRVRSYGEGYAPPEQIIGRPEPRSDLFALAGTLYHLATGREPEGCYTVGAIESRLADGTIPAEQRWFFELLAINLAEDPHDRYHSAAAIKSDLENRVVTQRVKCPHCEQANPVRHPFCRACCQPLTALAPLPCPMCGGRNRLGSRLCVHCGNRVG